MQKGIFAVLVLIAFLLGANLFRGNDAQAAKKYTYRALTTRNHQDGSDMGEVITNATAQGWEFVTTNAASEVIVRK